MKKIIVFILLCHKVFSQEVAVLQYGGGGDWYANPTAVPNLVRFTNNNCHSAINKVVKVKPNDEEIFNYPIVFMTGHGNVFFDDKAVENLRTYLKSGGFLHISDNYGMDKYIRRELKKVFPEYPLQELPKTHSIYNQCFKFPNGLPKIHEHDNKAPQGFGLFIDGRMVIFYDYESDLSDGWEDASVHNDPEQIRLKALKMGANIIQFVFNEN